MNNPKEFITFETAWCPGCGDFGILEALKETLQDMEKSPHEVLVVGGIGQAAKTPQYINANGFEGLHGRALPAAAAAKISNHKLTVIVDTGEGDSYGEGGNHFMHNIKRNVNITHFVHDNQIYGLTKGQASPTSDIGSVTDFTPDGVNVNPLNPIVAAIGLGAGFVARAFSGDKEQLKKIMTEAINYNGYALVDILQPCVSFNKINTYAWYKKRVYALPEDGSYNPNDKIQAFTKGLEWGDKIPTGVIYREDRPSFVDKVPFLQDAPLVDLPVETEAIKEFIQEFM